MSKRKPYVRKVPASWWLRHAFYTKYMIREGTSVFLTAYSLILFTGLLRLSQGAAAFNGWQEALTSPLAIGFHVVALALAVYHTVTWFSLAPKAIDLRLGERKLPDSWIIAGHYAALALVSVIVLLLVFW